MTSIERSRHFALVRSCCGNNDEGPWAAGLPETHGALFVNPGSAGPRRFKLPVAVAELRIEGRSVRVDVVELEVPRKSKRR